MIDAFKKGFESGRTGNNTGQGQPDETMLERRPTEDAESDRQKIPNAHTGAKPTTSLADRPTENPLIHIVLYYGSNLVVLVLLLTAPESHWSQTDLHQLLLFQLATWLLFALTLRSDPGYVTAAAGVAACTANDIEEQSALVGSTVQSGLLDDRDAEAFVWHKFPPMRAAFCKENKRFVALYDHWCPFVNTPIGERNHFRYWLLCLFQSLSLKQGLVILFQTGGAWTSRSSFMFLTLGFMLLFGGGLFIFHTVIAALNLTTHEMMKHDKLEYLAGTKGPCELPFSKGLCFNLRMFFFEHGIKLMWTKWVPWSWSRPKVVVTNSEDWWKHPWQNKYWTCC